MQRPRGGEEAAHRSWYLAWPFRMDRCHHLRNAREVEKLQDGGSPFALGDFTKCNTYIHIYSGISMYSRLKRVHALSDLTNEKGALRASYEKSPYPKRRLCI